MCFGGGSTPAPVVAPVDNSMEIARMQIEAQQRQAAAAQAAADQRYQREQASSQAAAQAQREWQTQQATAQQAATLAQQQRQDAQMTAQRDAAASQQTFQANQAQASIDREAQQRAQERADFDGRLSSSYSTALESAKQYFTTMGLDPEQFMGEISSKANSIKSSVPTLDGNPGTYFDGLGNSVYDDLTTAGQSKAGRELDAFASTGFDNQLISRNAGDDSVQAILGEQEQERRNYADNLLARGIVTDSGYQSALGSIDKQRFGVQSNLSEIAKAVLEGGRGDLRDIASQGRTAASNLKLGQQFNSGQFSQQINDEATQFLENLGGNVRSRVGDNLFDMSSILRSAGSGQGAQNTAFDPAAFFSATGGQDDEDEKDAAFIPQPLF